ncbi:hypothetical protein FF80_03537 [Devosia sp. LC5]|uniref:hypothetical protein n=1 Tax=Devosia sp. LC5 TaxID=1502724 RepID=UPI0004E2CEB7|nr:hypothetical protein [Devosia sp. LC5]KFC62443.1 hypothetical protein FF80_03537 [Devosia sp. LC5]
MDEPKLSPFALTPARIMLLALGTLLVIIAISTSLGGINAYQQLREANSAATQTAPTEAGAAQSAPETVAP